MESQLEQLARLLAYRDGRAKLVASHLHVAVCSHAMVVCPLAMAGEDTTVHVVAYGRVGRPPKLLWVADPRNRDDQYALFIQLGADIEAYFSQCIARHRYPQLWVSSSSAAAHLDLLADRLRYNRSNADVRRFGELLSYPASRIPYPGQQALHPATTVLSMHWVTGQQAGEDQHLAARLTWIDPPPGRNVLAAVVPVRST